MIKVRAKIKLYKGINKRQTAFYSGYRPLFKFVENSMTSGQVNLINQNKFKPGDEGIVEINFLNEEFLGNDFGVGKTFCFYESMEPLGEGRIVNIM